MQLRLQEGRRRREYPHTELHRRHTLLRKRGRRSTSITKKLLKGTVAGAEETADADLAQKRLEIHAGAEASKPMRP